jgi:hypothetical protein
MAKLLLEIQQNAIRNLLDKLVFKYDKLVYFCQAGLININHVYFENRSFGRLGGVKRNPTLSSH